MRRWIRAIHRDLGYMCVGLTLVYAVSGVAVNHIRDWNPNYRITRDTVALPDSVLMGADSPGFAELVAGAVGLEPTVRGTFRVDSVTLDVFLESATVRVALGEGHAAVERVAERRVLRAANLLHLNEPRGLWTLTADLFAVALLVLAVSGIFMLGGELGITGRGAWLTGVGILIPLLFLLLVT